MLAHGAEFDFDRLKTTFVTSAVMNFAFSCDPVNVGRGNLYLYKEDLGFSYLYGSATFFRRYDSCAEYPGIFGKGWLHAYESFLIADRGQDINSGRKEIVAVFPDIHRETFVYRDGEWFNEKECSNYFLKFTGTGYILTFYENGNRVIYEYDLLGRLTAVYDRVGAEAILLLYREDVTDGVPAGESHLEKILFPGGQYLQFLYAGNHVTEVTDHTGRSVRYSYDGDLLKTVHFPSGGEESYEYDEYAHITRLTGEDGREFIRNTYDKKGRVIRQTYPDGNYCDIAYFPQKMQNVFTFSDTGRTETYRYDEIVRKDYGDGVVETAVFDESGNPVSETDRNGNTTSRTYNARGQVIREEKPDGLVTEKAYFDNGLIAEEWDNAGNHKWYVYDMRGALVSEKKLISENEYVEWNYTVDDRMRRVTSTDPMGNVTTYAYDEPIPDPTYVLTAEGDTYTYTYDKAGRQTGITTDYGTVRKYYSETGEVSMVTDALGNTTRYFLDATGNILKKIKPNQCEKYIVFFTPYYLCRPITGRTA